MLYSVFINSWNRRAIGLIPLVVDAIYISFLGLYSLNSHAAFSSVSESYGWVYLCGC
jgi:hypothetical protein